jgi:FAD binding domain in molybdopterin dehydrogenase
VQRESIHLDADCKSYRSAAARIPGAPLAGGASVAGHDKVLCNLRPRDVVVPSAPARAVSHSRQLERRTPRSRDRRRLRRQLEVGEDGHDDFVLGEVSGVLRPVTPSPRQHRIYCDEIFVPVRYVAPVPDLSAALTLVDAQTTCYQRADTPAPTIAAHARTPGARCLAGGTNLVDLMKLPIETPEHHPGSARGPENMTKLLTGGTRSFERGHCGCRTVGMKKLR